MPCRGGTSLLSFCRQSSESSGGGRIAQEFSHNGRQSDTRTSVRPRRSLGRPAQLPEHQRQGLLHPCGTNGLSPPPVASRCVDEEAMAALSLSGRDADVEKPFPASGPGISRCGAGDDRPLAYSRPPPQGPRALPSEARAHRRRSETEGAFELGRSEERRGGKEGRS